ncbi:hypothetical protein KSD_02360 [Ktedonobacter sp. SOSP1-85]|uniref:hypothetical protein n=1 Tax=Ktedonobacter sp. SOSP1-85 TaxID=2778367 RepID=UPI0019160E47|nr:hypothetical protein [Ktedonobacter sp. SOSP1-85]GHO72465.1 hypothetical protein KSD_02360 [Ktedonobacter sp. SOSP1-85]
MEMIDGEECYSREELFAEVRRRGQVIYDSLFEEWQKSGVMAVSRRKGRGRKKGVAGWWSRWVNAVRISCFVCMKL